MRLDRIELALRRRSPWEAIDLGLVMVRHWHGPLCRVWLATVLPVAVGILALLWQWPLAGMLIVWWMKPIADRVLLKFFSEAIFGEPPAPREVWRSLPALLSRSGLISRLTLRRFSYYRAFELPVLQLEGQRGKALRQRNRTLSRKISGHAIYLMQVCVCVVMIFEIAQIQLIGLLTPGDALSGFSLYRVFSGDAGLVQSHLFTAAWLIAESVVEPFYVAGGFSLYLNRRSELEGWDIEMAFRHMAESHAGAPPGRAAAGFSFTHSDDPERIIEAALRRGAENRSGADTPGRGVKLAVAALLLGAQFVLGAPDVLAAAVRTPEKAGAISGEASRAIQEVLSDPVFGREVEETRWRLRDKGRNPERKPAEFFAWLRTVVGWLAWGARWVLYLLMAAALAALLVVLYRYSGRAVRKLPRLAARAPESLFGLDLRPASLPADIPAAAWAEAEAGRVAAALSLLYRGALVVLIERQRVPFRDGDTENICRQRLSGHVGEAARAYFSALVDAWKASAYAGLPPSRAGVHTLCREWPEHFGHGHGGGA